MNGSYVRNCAIHHSFNRALTAHGIHDLLVEGNVAYDIMGHTFFVVSCLCNVTLYVYVTATPDAVIVSFTAQGQVH